MPVELNPKVHFKTLAPEHHKVFLDLIANPSIRMGLTMSMAFLAGTNATPEQLEGARRFMAILTTIADEDVAPREMPPKSLIQLQ